MHRKYSFKYITYTTSKDDDTNYTKFTKLVCVCVFLLLNARPHLNIIALFACHFPSSHSIYNKLHRLAMWVTEAFIKNQIIPDENILCWKSRFHADYTANIQHADINRHVSMHWFMNTLIVVKMISLYIKKKNNLCLSPSAFVINGFNTRHARIHYECLHEWLTCI